VVLVCEEGVWFVWFNWVNFNREKTKIKNVMAWLVMEGRKIIFKNVIHLGMCLYLYMCGNNEDNVTYI